MSLFYLFQVDMFKLCRGVNVSVKRGIFGGLGCFHAQQFEFRSVSHMHHVGILNICITMYRCFLQQVFVLEQFKINQT